MNKPPPPSDPNKPHASRGEKVRTAKTDQFGGVGRGIGEAPNSRIKKFAIWFVIFLIVLFIVIDFVDRENAKKEKNGWHYSPTSDLLIAKAMFRK